MTTGTINSAPASNDPPRVVCVVLNWNGWRDTIPCLQSLVEQDYPALGILVVDNASTDDSVARIAGAFPAIEILQSPGNNGFASGCNLGTRLALERGAAFVWLLNNDTFAPPDTLTKLVAAASDPRIGMVGTVLFYAHNPTEVQAWGGGSVMRWIGFGTHFRKPTPLGSDSYVTFASVLLRSELLTTVGLMDERFFMYFEDADLCLRARAAGWKFTVATDTAVLHKEGASARPNGGNPRVHRIFTASGMRFLSRHGRPRPVALTLFALSRFSKRVLSADFPGAGGVVRGILEWWHDSPGAPQKKS